MTRSTRFQFLTVTISDSREPGDDSAVLQFKSVKCLLDLRLVPVFSAFQRGFIECGNVSPRRYGNDSIALIVYVTYPPVI